MFFNERIPDSSTLTLTFCSRKSELETRRDSFILHYSIIVVQQGDGDFFIPSIHGRVAEASTRQKSFVVDVIIPKLLCDFERERTMQS